MQILDETVKNQEKKMTFFNKSIEREEQEDDDDDLERDPYVNIQIKRERMPYHNQNVYRPLATRDQQDPVSLQF
jgi:hypothetical protein